MEKLEEQNYITLRDRTGKSARIAEKIRKKIGIEVDVKPETVTEETLAPVWKTTRSSAEPEKQPEVQAEPKIEKSEEKK